MNISNSKWRFLLRLDQIGVALIPVVIGFFALLIAVIYLKLMRE